jgi:hypothetical protein
MTHRIFLCEERVPFLVNEMAAGKVKVVEVDDNEMTTVDVTIEDSYDLLKVFHAGIEAGDAARKKVAQAKPNRIFTSHN